MTLLILILSLFLLVSGVRWFLARAPQRGKRFLLQLLLIVLALLALWMALTGRLHWLFALISSMLPFARRLLPLLIPLLRWLPKLRQQRRQRAGQAQSGQQSQAHTDWLEMQLDHDSGAINGRILQGRFAGRMLDQLSDSELLQLYRQCAGHDPQALKLLDAYIERHRPELWDNTSESASSNDQQQQGTTANSSMSADEAYQILGLEPGATEEQIVQAHKRMMQKLHPDRGGSNYLAAKINQAKQTLLG
ncbi:molecular chaperone DnaJ [Motiliproteus coralliicola]|uniref:Molecular chaperone DnaJ n=1 Tax=Motiliproteus coralliicola TaxID=2283196 RepID=A0A369WYG0_9GAMM|nr:DnaJ domain-containing protein [Motiliproteus coralliicola]RDE24535.1 molecular chaperone DnaJ [Motiliproteus coralliicola]